MPNLGTPFRFEKNQDSERRQTVTEEDVVGAMALRPSARVVFFGLFSSSFLTSSAFHCFKGES